jgi:hypothetical protein
MLEHIKQFRQIISDLINLFTNLTSQKYRDNNILLILVGEVSARVVSAVNPYGRNLSFLDQSCYFFFQVTPQLYSQG